MKRLLLAALSGLLLAGCFPPLGWTWLLWVWPWPLLAGLWSEAPVSGKRGLLLGYVSGLAFYLTTISWIIQVHWVGWLALSLYLSLYPAVWACLVAQLASRPRLGNAWIAAAWWAGLEWLRGILLTGFGWNELGIALAPLSWLIQPAEWIGSAGLSVPVMFVSGAIFVAWKSRQWRAPAMVIGVTLIAWSGLGAWLGHRAAAVPARNLSAIVVQPNVPQEEKWELSALESVAGTLTDEARNELDSRVLDRYDQLRVATQSALKEGPADLVIWPESCLHYPFHTEFNRGFLDEVGRLGPFTLVFGCDVFDGGAYNACVAQQGGFLNAEIYRKVHLVVYGEYLPLRKELPWIAEQLADLLPADFNSGTITDPLESSLEGVSLIPTVCFEDVVPRHVRRFVRPKPQLIVNVANDGWFNRTAQQEQHFWNSRLRSVELRRPLIRSANTGVTFAVSSTGALLGRLEKYTEATLRVVVPVPKSSDLTFYARYGDVFASTMAGLTLLAAFFLKLRPHRS